VEKYFSEEIFNFFPLTLDASKFDKPVESVATAVEPSGGEDRFEDIFS